MAEMKKENRIFGVLLALALVILLLPLHEAKANKLVATVSWLEISQQTNTESIDLKRFCSAKYGDTVIDKSLITITIDGEPVSGGVLNLKNLVALKDCSNTPYTYSLKASVVDTDQYDAAYALTTLTYKKTHKMVYRDAADATCTARGHIAGYTCSWDNCDYHSSDAGGTNPITDENWYTTDAPLGHEWIYTEKTETGHKGTCNRTGCGATIDEDHTGMGDGICDLCGYHKHNWETGWTVDATSGTHYHKCTVTGCDAKKEEAEHQPGSWTAVAGTDTHQRVCAVCLNTYGSAESHHFVLMPVSEDEHQMVCSECGEKTGETGAHQYTLRKDDDQYQIGRAHV